MPSLRIDDISACLFSPDEICVCNFLFLTALAFVDKLKPGAQLKPCLNFDGLLISLL